MRYPSLDEVGDEEDF